MEYMFNLYIYIYILFLFLADNSLLIHELNGVLEIVSCLFLDNMELKIKASGLLGFLTLADCCRIDIIQYGGIPLVLSNITSDNIELSNRSIIIVSNIALDEDGVKILTQTECLELLCKLLSSSNDDSIKSNVCAAIGNLADIEMNRAIVYTEGCVDILMDLLSKTENYELKGRICFALSRLCENGIDFFIII